MDHPRPCDLARSPGGLGPSSPPDNDAAHGGLSLLRGAIELWGEHRWVRIHAEPRQPQAQRTVDKQWRQQSADEVKAFRTLCRTAFACEADARQALAHFAHDVQTTFLSDSTISSRPQYGKRGRPGPGAQPDQIVYPIAGALASRSRTA